MEPKPGWYSVIQLCPDPVGAEALNVGVVLLSPEHRILDVRLLSGGVKGLLSVLGTPLTATEVQKAMESIQRRLRSAVDEIRTKEDLDTFGSSLGNDLIMLPSRLTMVTNPNAAMLELVQRVLHPRVTVRRPKGIAKGSVAKLME